jgi:hypothetical protein
MLICAECKSKAGKHHIISKGSKSIIVYMPINEINLCKSCHKKIHSSKEMDCTYKAMLQKKLQNLLPDKFYSLNDLRRILKLNNLLTKLLAKHVYSGENGYNTADIINYLMCGKSYC